MRDLRRPDVIHKDEILGEVWETLFPRDDEMMHALCFPRPMGRIAVVGLVARLNLPGQDVGVLTAPDDRDESYLWRWTRPYQPGEKDEVLDRLHQCRARPVGHY